MAFSRRAAMLATVALISSIADAQTPPNRTTIPANQKAITTSQALAAGAMQAAGVNASLAVVAVPGGAVSRTLAARALDTLALPDFKSVADTDDTMSFTRALAQNNALGNPSEVVIPCGTYTISSAIRITTHDNQGLYLHGASSSCVTINQTGDADGFDIQLNNYGNHTFAGGSTRISGFRLVMANAASTTRSGVSIITNGKSGVAAAPMQVDDLSFTDNLTGSYWANGLFIAKVGVAYLSRINNYNHNSGGGVGINVTGDATSYLTSLSISDSTMIGGKTGAIFGSYIQGVHVHNLSTINTLNALIIAPTAGLNEEYNIDDSYLMGHTIISNVSAIKFHHNYFDNGHELAAGDKQVSINNSNILSMDHNTYQSNGFHAGVTGLSIEGAAVYGSHIDHEVFNGFLNGGTALALNVRGHAISISGTIISNSTNSIADTSTVANAYSDTMVNNNFYSVGPLSGTPVKAIKSLEVSNSKSGAFNTARPELSAATAAIGGSALSAGACATGAIAVAGSTTRMAVAASPMTYPGDGAVWSAYVSAAGTVMVKLCALVAITPVASAYNVRVLP